MTVGELIDGLRELSEAEIWEIYCVGRGISVEEAIATILDEVASDTLITMIATKLSPIDF